MEDLGPFVEQLRSRRRRLRVAAAIVPLIGLMIAALPWIEFYRAGFVRLADGVPAPKLPLLQTINLYLTSITGGAIALIGPILIYWDMTLWRQSDVIVQLWDRIKILERHLQDAPNQPPQLPGDIGDENIDSVGADEDDPPRVAGK